MGGNDKTDALGGTTWNDTSKAGGVQRNFFFSIRTIGPVLVIYDISRAGMHLGEPEKPMV
jgi:hypothetical protein